MKNMLLIALISLLVSMPSFAGKAALVKILKGDARAIIDGKETKLKAEDWIDGGAILKTGEKSFVKLVFIDKSQMNVGPGTEIKIEKFHNKDAGVIDLVKGKIRSQVTKDYLQIQGKDRSKLFIKTPNAVMGIRGTDFMISTNGKNTAAILFEGEVVFNHLKDRNITDSAKLDQIVDNGVRMFPGEFSAVGADMNSPTVPALLNVSQREKLEKNANFEKNDAAAKAQRSVVPGGLSGNVVASRPNIDSNAKHDDARASSNAEGYVKDGNIKPVNGSFVHIDSATVIAPGKDARLDSNTNTFIASDRSGTVTADGSYVPPKGIDIKENGQIFVTPVAVKELNPAQRPEVITSRGAVQIVPSSIEPSTLDMRTGSGALAVKNGEVVEAPSSTNPAKGGVTTTPPTNGVYDSTHPAGAPTSGGSTSGAMVGATTGGSSGTVGTTGMVFDPTTSGGSSGGTTGGVTTGGVVGGAGIDLTGGVSGGVSVGGVSGGVSTGGVSTGGITGALPDITGGASGGVSTTGGSTGVSAGVNVGAGV